MKRKGHGSKHGVIGKLGGGSPWSSPDDEALMRASRRHPAQDAGARTK